MKCAICGVVPRVMWTYGGAWEWLTFLSDYPVCRPCADWACNYTGERGRTVSFERRGGAWLDAEAGETR